MEFYDFPYIGNVIIPTDELTPSFFRGLGQPPTSYNILPIGSMYAIYGNIYHQYTPNVSIDTIHGSYGLLSRVFLDRHHSHHWAVDGQDRHGRLGHHESLRCRSVAWAFEMSIGGASYG